MQKTAGKHTAAIAAGLLYQKRCGEPDAGPYCIAKPTSYGRITELLLLALIIFYGGYASIVAIETPGGDDDQQWLTFWVMFVASMVLENNFARILLSQFPFYYQTKLAVVVWLMFFGGAGTLYRKLRMRMVHVSPFFNRVVDKRNKSAAQSRLNTITEIGGKVITDKITLLEQELQRNPTKRNATVSMVSSETESSWEYDYTNGNREIDNTVLTPDERLFKISQWILSSQGMEGMETVLHSDIVALLLSHAASVTSFQPKFLNIFLIGTKPGKRGELPVMDDNGKADCYVQFATFHKKTCSSENFIGTPHLEGNFWSLDMLRKLKYMKRTVTSRIAFRTLHPEWNQSLEIRLRDGIMEKDGNYRNDGVKDKILLIEAWDADCGKWGVAYEVFRVLSLALVCALFVTYVGGAIDFMFQKKSLSPDEWWWKGAIRASVFFNTLGLALSWMKSVVMRADDEFIGNSAVPVEVLTDRRAHSLLLKLRDGETERGILRVRLCLSEH